MSYLGLNYIGRLVSNFKDYYAGINAATLTGAIDVIIVQQEDGTFISSPFHVRFGKLGVLRSREKIVDIEINGEPVEIHMKLGESGEAFFVVEAEKDTDLPNYLVTSPLPPFENSEATLTSTSPELAPELKPTQDERTTISSTLAPSLDLHNMGVLRQDSLMGKRQKDLLAALKQCALEAESHTPSPPEAPKEVKVFQATSVMEGRQAEMPFRPIVTSREEQLASNSDVDVLRRLTPGKSKQTKRRRSLKKKKGNNRRSLDGAAPFSTLAVPGEELPANEDISNSDVEQLDDEIEGIMAKPMEPSQPQPLLFPEEVNNPIVQITSPGATQESHWGAVAKTMGPDFHFFSDTEVCSPEGSRPGTPVHSDSEYELGSCRDRSHALSDPGQNNQQSWRWGELPSPPGPRPSPVLTASGPPARDASTEDKEGGELSITETDSAAQKAQAQSDAQRSTLSSMFSFMRQTKKLRHDASSIPTGKAGQPVGGEIYLDDLDTDALDPELAALYFPPQHLHHIPPASQTQNPFKDEDTESGRGASLPHSPPTVNADSDSEDSQRQRHVTREVRKEFPEILLSLCGGLADMPEPPENLFLQYLVTFDDLAENPRLLESPDLVVKIGSKYYSWSAASPLVMSWFLFGRPLPSQTVDVLTDRRSGTSTSSVAEESKKDESPRERTYSWWSWRRSQPQPKKDVEGGPGLTDEHFKSTAETEASHEHLQDVVVEAQPKELENSNSLPSTESTEVRVSGTSSDDSDVGDASSPRKIPYARRSYYDGSDKYRKTLRLSSEQIALLQLREGPNEAVFSVTTAYQGTSRCKCHIYLWRFDDKVVISDIDGTITKSDVLGHILPIVGKDWAQSGVAQLFTKIKNNGYRILYLSARAIGQASVTREYLRSVRQGGLSLPDGPLLLNPTSLLSAFHREVIEKKPEEFKISCLRDIQALFPTDSNPYYAGYGNKVNDVWAYRAVGIPISRIFTINHKGELKHELTETFQSSYSKQSFIVDLVFPPLKASQQSSHEVSDFSQYAYWREPLPELAPTDCASLCAPYEDKLSKGRKTSRREK